ncbi:hypothetical protein N8820_02770 [Candidatus Pseudothioglobus singularis]|nr:hypothetical protein [Candidatus Pseudothioglobus singularis]
MSKNKILIFTLLLQLLFVGSVQAKCDFKSFKFGDSYKSTVSKLKIDSEFVEPEIKGASQQFLFAPGEEVCKSEKAFQGVPIQFVFLYNKLVEIQLMSLSEAPKLVTWAESIYGLKENKPNSFYDEFPIARWSWEDSKAVIAYSVESAASDVIESVIIQSLNHQQSYEKFAIEQEGGK